MNDGFYRAFEERYYAPRELIKELRKQYLPFTQQLANVYPGSPTFDAGCGRGEWLELMNEQCFLPTGVDLDDGMLSACIELQLPAKKGDAIAHMSSLSNESQSVVSAFHVVEHVSFEQLRIFVSEALRVLKPGGILIMETPNPENIAVSTRNFYLDPTHQRPIPPQLLAFVAEFEGFERVKTLRLQEPKDIASRETIGLTEVINFVSPDYAVIAQKKADASLMAKSQELFDAEYGVSLDTLSGKLDLRLARIEAQSVQAIKLAKQAEAKAQQAEAKAQQAEAKAQQAEAKAQQAEAKAQQAEAKAQQADAKAQQAEAKAEQAEAKAQQAEAKAQQAEEKAQQSESKVQQAESIGQHYAATLNSVYASKSWRLTAPLRWAFGQVRRLKHEGLKSRVKAFVKKSLRKINHELLLRPSLRQKLIGVSRRLGIHAALKTLLRKAQGYPASSTYSPFVNDGGLSQANLKNLSPRARQIYADLKKAVEEKNKQGNC